jgi:hypothetical protein
LNYPVFFIEIKAPVPTLSKCVEADLQMRQRYTDLADDLSIF